jgi:hypothetical protein
MLIRCLTKARSNKVTLPLIFFFFRGYRVIRPRDMKRTFGNRSS